MILTGNVPVVGTAIPDPPSPTHIECLKNYRIILYLSRTILQPIASKFLLKPQ